MANHMFVRIGTKEHVENALKMLEQFNPTIEANEEITTVYAPDGDIVFQALKKDQSYICRYHDEVFERTN